MRASKAHANTFLPVVETASRATQ